MVKRIVTAAGAPRCGRGMIAMLAGALALSAAGPNTAGAQDTGRAEQFELFVLGQFSLSDEVDINNVDVEYDDSFGGGVGIGYNFTQNFNLNGTVVIGEANLEASVGGLSVEEDATFIAPEVNLDWNILDESFTPFLTAGAGAMIFTGGDVDETNFSYGAGAGVRWDMAEDMFLKIWYRAKWFELDDADDEFLIHTINIGFGLMR